jgi:hypothetical protein
MAKNSFFKGLVGVIAGSSVGIALVLNAGWSVWWQVVVAIIIGGLVGLVAADPKWTFGKIKLGLIKIVPKKFPKISLPAIEREMEAGYLVFRFLLCCVVGVAVFAFASKHLANFFSSLFGVIFPINNFFPGVIIILAIILPSFLMAFFFLFQALIFNKDFKNFSCQAERIAKKEYAKELPLVKQFILIELDFFLIGLIGVLKLLLFYCLAIVYFLANIIFLFVALVYLFREVWKSAWHLSVVLSIALAIVIAAIFHSWLLGLGCGAGYFTVSLVLSRITFASLSEVYKKYGKVWRWKSIASL